jgi:TonB family protein
MVRSLTIGSKLDSQIGKPDVVKRLSNLLLLPLLMITAEMALFPRFSFGDVKKDRKNVSSRIADEIARLRLHKIYVSDFLDVSDTRTDKGCYFSSVFSTLSKDQAKNFENLSRVGTQKFLVTAGLSATNLHNPESLAKLSAATGADAVLFGTLVLEKKHATLTLFLREAASGKELYQTQYRENLDPSFEALFPAVTSPDGQFFYFPGLDGITIPKCVYCPLPEYTDAARKAGINGTVSFSVVFTEQGKLKDVRVVRSLDPTLDQAAIEVIRKWSANPAKDASGNPVPVRVHVEVSFQPFSRLY